MSGAGIHAGRPRRRSPCRAKLLVAFLDAQRIRTRGAGAWENEGHTLHLLRTVPRHRAVDFCQNLGLHFNNQVRSDTDDVRVLGRVVNLA